MNGLRWFNCQTSFEIGKASGGTFIVVEQYCIEHSLKHCGEENMVDSFCIFILVTSTESVKKLRRATLMTFAETELMMAAGESSKTNRQKFIEKRRQMLREFECKNLPSDNQDNAVITHDAERRDSTEDFHFYDAPFKDTPLASCGQTWERTVHLGLASSDPENRRRKTLGKFQT